MDRNMAVLKAGFHQSDICFNLLQRGENNDLFVRTEEFGKNADSHGYFLNHASAVRNCLVQIFSIQHVKTGHPSFPC